MAFKKGNTVGMGTRFQKGHKTSVEVREKISIGNQIPKPKPEGFGIGRIQTDKTKQKISEKKQGTSFGFKFQKGHKCLNTGRTHFKKGHEQSDKWKEWRKKYILPKFDTSIEIKIQNYLKQLGVDFFTHQYMKDIEHGYQCDILIPAMELIIECDGDYWHKYPVGNDLDHIRTKELIDKGFKVLRLWEHEIKVMSLDDFEKRLRGG